MSGAAHDFAAAPAHRSSAVRAGTEDGAVLVSPRAPDALVADARQR